MVFNILLCPLYELYIIWTTLPHVFATPPPIRLLRKSKLLYGISRHVLARLRPLIKVLMKSMSLSSLL